MLLPRMPHGVVFDMDGVIFDTEVLYRDVMITAASEQGADLPVAVYQRLIGLPGEACIRILTDYFGPGFNVDALWADARDRFHQAVEAGPPLKPGVIELLDHLADIGLPHAIATSSKHAAVSHHLEAHGLEHRFPIVVAFGDYARGKPDPDPFLTAARRLGLEPSDCVALEDSHNGVRAASSAGMMTIMVPDLLPATDEMRDLCTGIARDLHEVRSVVLA